MGYGSKEWQEWDSKTKKNDKFQFFENAGSGG